jgi:D-amino peptidase
MNAPARVFISVDMEGVAGITSWQDLEQNREGGRALMLGEANAAVAGAFDAGAREVLVADAHDGGRSLAPQGLDPRARLVRGSPRRWFMVSGLAKGFDVALFVGYHARAGTAQGAMDHTYSGGAVRSLRIDGRPAGELVLNAAYCGHFGVPVGLVTGDDALAGQTREWLIGAQALVVKESLSRFAQVAEHPDHVRARIREAAAAAVRSAPSLAPLGLRWPVEVELDFNDRAQAELAALVPTVERRGDYTLAFRAFDAPSAYSLTMALQVIAGRAGELS